MDILFMNSENTKTSKYHVLVLKLIDKLNLTNQKKSNLYQILVFPIHGKT